jgi:hypothetical protein
VVITGLILAVTELLSRGNRSPATPSKRAERVPRSASSLMGHPAWRNTTELNMEGYQYTSPSARITLRSSTFRLYILFKLAVFAIHMAVYGVRTVFPIKPVCQWRLATVARRRTVSHAMHTCGVGGAALLRR